MPNTILIIGAGQIGSRHLQALSRLKTFTTIYVFDISTDSLKVAESRFEEVRLVNGFVGETFYINNLAQLPSKIDIAFITTGANVRRLAFEQLVKQVIPTYIVFEKVLFQKLEDYNAVARQLKNLDIKAFVNFPRRQYPFYQTLKQELAMETTIHVSVSGTQWGLACNGLHIVDLFAYLSGDQRFKYRFDGLNEGFVESKRAGFYEVFGTIDLKTQKGSTLRMTCFENGSIPLVVDILTPTKHYIITEDASTPQVLTLDKSVDIQVFTPLYQSQLSNLTVESLLENGIAELTNFEDAVILHTPFIKGLLAHFNKATDRADKNLCPIT